jgi:Lrp/AsnC family transcriptional regulator, regulator for asnA, asnC and gidA
MDTVDLKIIQFLMKDSQMPFSEIAKKLNLGVDTVIRRYHKLKSEEVIFSATIGIDLKKSGIEGHVMFMVNCVSGADQEKMYEEFSKTTNLLTVIHTVGDYDFLLQGLFSDFDSLVLLQKEISKVPGILYLSVTCVSAKDFIPSFPTLEYYKSAILKSPVDFKEKH